MSKKTFTSWCKRLLASIKMRIKALSPLQKNFMINVLGTMLSITLTFGVNAMVSSKKKLEAKRLTAMMVIADIDKSIETLKAIQEEDEQGYLAAKYTLENIDSIDNVGYPMDDTLYIVYNYLLGGLSVDDALEFNESSEKMFHSTQDAWTNLEDVTFLSNIDDFYKSRQTLRKVMTEHIMWKKPVGVAETDAICNDSDIIETREGTVRYIKELLERKRCRKYIENYNDRESTYKGTLQGWTNIKETNMFLMNISDEELAQFVAHTSRESRPAKDKDIIGTWVDVVVDTHTAELELRSNHTFRLFQSYSILPSRDYSGKAYLEMTVVGEWRIEGDSLVTVHNLSGLKVDLNEKNVVYHQETRDSVRRSLQSQRDEEAKYARQIFQTNGGRRASATNIDIPCNRLELTGPDGKLRHYKRKK